ncbi:MAG: histidine kinase, partial [Candidatus Heimdallarchaeota archaeon]|nr:histidine kinase [Candidatus Heimdallarchaeota archaeon]
NKGEAALWAHQGLSTEYMEKVRYLSIDEPLIVKVLKSKKSFVSHEPFHCNKYVIESEIKSNTNNILTFSLRSHEKVIGFIDMVVPLDRKISDDDMRVLESVSNEVGIAVENIRLFEETKKAYEELKSLDKMKDDFLSNVSHELKTPLVTITGYSELMCNESLGALNEGQKKAMEVLNRNSERLRHLIDSLVYLSMEKAGKVGCNFVLLQTVDIIKQAVLDTLPVVENNNLTLTTDVPNELPMIYGDVDRLIEVITNLIDNSIKFTPSGGEIIVAAREETEYIHITVSDTGIGIPSNLLSKIFDRFYQVDASTTRRYGGTGLGLHIVKSIIDMHNGQIWAE